MRRAGGGGGDGGGVTPPPPPVITRSEAARFLRQATFGPTAAEIDRVVQIGYDGWLDQQFAAPPSLHTPALKALGRPLQEVVRLHASSGTTGKPIVVAYTKEDVDVWTSVMVRTFASCGLHAGDVIDGINMYKGHEYEVHKRGWKEQRDWFHKLGAADRWRVGRTVPSIIHSRA